MKRAFSSVVEKPWPLVIAGTGLIAATYGLIRLAYGLFLVDVQRDLDIDVAAAGAVSAGASLVYCVAALVGFLTAERHPRVLVAVAAASAALGAWGMAVAPSGGVFAVCSILGSAGAGFASPALVAVLQRNPATKERPDAQAQVNAGTGPGLIVAGALALLLLPDWRTAWMISAAIAIAAGAAVLLVDRRPARASAARRALPPRSWFRAHARLIVAAVLMGAGSAAIWNFGRTLLADAGAGTTVSVTAWIAIGAGGAAVLATATGLDRIGPRAAWALTVGVLALATVALALVQSAAPLALAVCLAFGWGYTAGSGVLIAWTARIDPPRAPAGTAMLFITLILGQAIGAAALGALIPVTGYAPAFALAAGLASLAVAVACWPPVRGRYARPKKAAEAMS